MGRRKGNVNTTEAVHFTHAAKHKGVLAIVCAGVVLVRELSWPALQQILAGMLTVPAEVADLSFARLLSMRSATLLDRAITALHVIFVMHHGWAPSCGRAPFVQFQQPCLDQSTPDALNLILAKLGKWWPHDGTWQFAQ